MQLINMLQMLFHFYSSVFNTLNLCICLIGSKVFGRTSAAILTAVVTCTLVTTSSFFQNFKIIFSYEEPCYDNSSMTIIENCTSVTNGTFIGLFQTNTKIMKKLLTENLYPHYLRDCSDPTVEVNFFIGKH